MVPRVGLVCVLLSTLKTKNHLLPRQATIFVNWKYNFLNYQFKRSEREWRTWVDEKFVHVISPNIYRTFSEAVESFKWFDKAGDWQSQFSNTERNLIIYLGSTVMYLLGKRLKYK